MVRAWKTTRTHTYAYTYASTHVRTHANVSPPCSSDHHRLGGAPVLRASKSPVCMALTRSAVRLMLKMAASRGICTWSRRSSGTRIVRPTTVLDSKQERHGQRERETCTHARTRMHTHARTDIKGTQTLSLSILRACAVFIGVEGVKTTHWREGGTATRDVHQRVPSW